MKWWHLLDPTGDNFLGAGPKWGRAISDAMTVGGTELNRPDPYGLPRHTALAKSIGGASTGAASGAGTGFLVGGPYGALAGGVLGGLGGGIGGLTGATNNTSGLGVLKNLGIGTGGGLLGGAGALAAGGGGLGAGSAAGGASEMLPYMPTSTPSMGMAGSTLGGGIGSPLNLGMDDISTGGAGSAGPMSQFFANVKKLNQIRSLSNMMSGGQQNLQQQEAQQRQNSAQRIQELYKMFPGLLPGGSPQQHGRINFGG